MPRFYPPPSSSAAGPREWSPGPPGVRSRSGGAIESRTRWRGRTAAPPDEQELSVKIAVIGLGYVGLPLAMVFAESGASVVGIEAVAARCDEVNAGRSYIQDVQSDALKAMVDKGLIQRHHRLRRHRGLRRRHHLPADAAQRQPRARPHAGHGRDREAGRPPAARPARHPREHHLPGHHARRAGARSSRPAPGSPPASTSTSPSRRSASTPAAPTTRPRARPRSSAGSRRRARRGRSRSTGPRSTTSSRSAPPRSPR